MSGTRERIAAAGGKLTVKIVGGQDVPRPLHESRTVARMPRMGDRIGSALESLGVTPERWKAVKGAMGLPPTCNCEERKRYLNELSERLGESAVDAVRKLFGWK